jgi:hypothetical protein
VGPENGIHVASAAVDKAANEAANPTPKANARITTRVIMKHHPERNIMRIIYKSKMNKN